MKQAFLLIILLTLIGCDSKVDVKEQNFEYSIITIKGHDYIRYGKGITHDFDCAKCNKKKK